MTVHERKSFYKEQSRFYIDMTLLELSLHLTTLIEQYGPNARIDRAITWATHWKHAPVAPVVIKE